MGATFKLKMLQGSAFAPYVQNELLRVIRYWGFKLAIFDTTLGLQFAHQRTAVRRKSALD
jgi:hypothetical protein